MSSSLRNTVIRSLSAVGATQEAQFYAQLFAAQDPERFALIVLDPRCLKNPLLEALVSNLRILADLKLTPVLLVGALDDDPTSVKFQSQRLARALDSVGVRTAKLNTDSYGLFDEVRKQCRANRIPVLELSNTKARLDLSAIATALQPAKTIFLQPSGGISDEGRRVAVINLDRLSARRKTLDLTPGQDAFLDHVSALNKNPALHGVYVMASPLNLLAELFTTQGSGTMLRRAAVVKQTKTLAKINKTRLRESIEDAFDKPLDEAFFKRDIHSAFIEANFRGGAIFTQLSGLPYLSKFWVSRAAQGEGIARDIWDAANAVIPDFFWRSRMGNPFNDWYMRSCDGMQISGDWRVFWKGLRAPDLPTAITAAASADDDFLTP